MRHHAGHQAVALAPGGAGRGGRLEEQDRRREGDEPRVLHRAVEGRHGQEVELGERRLAAQVALELDQHGRGRGQGGGSLGGAAAGGDDAHRHRLARAVEHVERAGREREQVGGERRRGRELDPATAVPGRLRAHLRRVGERAHAVGHAHRHLPRDLEARVVEAGDREARVGRLEVAERVPDVVDLLAEQAVSRAEAAGVLDVDARRPGADLLVEREADKAAAAGGLRSAQATRRPGTRSGAAAARACRRSGRCGAGRARCRAARLSTPAASARRRWPRGR